VAWHSASPDTAAVGALTRPNLFCCVDAPGSIDCSPKSSLRPDGSVLALQMSIRQRHRLDGSSERSEKAVAPIEGSLNHNDF